jgi:hypothetical protein
MPIKVPSRLIVEGYDDLQSVASLMGEHTPWPEDKRKAPVWIEISNGAADILKDGFLSVYLKDPELRTLGVMFDADARPAERYARVATLCKQFFEFPAELPKGGAILENGEHERFGLWIMPDNSSEGDLETFLKYLVPPAAQPIWEYAVSCVKQARETGCPCKDCHVTKANLYTWLAWQDPPAQTPGRALTKRVLDPRLPYAAAFVTWFMDLYGLSPLRFHIPTS